MGNEDLKYYLQCIFNRVSIAVATSVIISKPPQLKAEEYAERIQEALLQNWMRRKEPSLFDDKILAFQRGNILNRITELILPTNDFGVTNDDLNSLEEIPDVCCADFDITSDKFSESEEESNEISATKGNISFIEAIVQLKFAVESSRSVSVDQVQSFLEGKSESSSAIEKTGQEVVVSQRGLFSEDSGFGDSAPLTLKSNSSVPSSILRYVTHSVKADALLERCLTSVTTACRGWILSEPAQSFAEWRGSLFEYLVTVLRALPDSPLVTGSFSTFLTSLAADLWTSQQSDKLINLEYQLAMMKELCYNKYITETVIETLMLQIESLAKKLSSQDIYSEGNLHELYLIEQTPLFLDLLTSLFDSWLEFIEPFQDMKTITAISSVVDLWKMSSGKRRLPKVEKSMDGVYAEKWKDICEKLVTSSAKLFPLISSQAWDLMSSINSFKANNDASLNARFRCPFDS